MDKKIGIITFHNADNYGAILQAYATQKFLENNGYEAKIINFYHNNSSKQRPFYRKLISFFKSFLKANTRNAMIKHLKCNRFRNRYLKQTIKYFGDESIFLSPPIMDVYISGSDQILNFDLTRNSVAFYLSFVQKGKRISYGSSFGKSQLNSLEIDAVHKYLSKFDALSFREKEGYLLASKYISQCKETIVVDPVFLIGFDGWNDLVKMHKMKIEEKYIFVYGIENNELFNNIVAKIHEEYKLPIFAAYSSSFVAPSFVKNVSNSNPQKFLSILKNAYLVVTNSFHGTAFSILFKKRFICVDPLVRRSRIVEILEKIDCSNKLICNFVQSLVFDEHIIDGKKAYAKMEKYIDFSREYLIGAIEHD